MEILDRGFNAAVMTIANRLFPAGFDISDNAPETISDLCKVWSKGRPVVWNGASDQTIFGDNEVNHAFRAWHDHCHLRPIIRAHNRVTWSPALAHSFTEKGEFDTMLEQERDLVAIYGRTDKVRNWIRILNAEIMGQFEYKEINGEFPTNKFDFVCEYIIDPMYALSMKF